MRQETDIFLNLNWSIGLYAHESRPMFNGSMSVHAIFTCTDTVPLNFGLLWLLLPHYSCIRQYPVQAPEGDKWAEIRLDHLSLFFENLSTIENKFNERSGKKSMGWKHWSVIGLFCLQTELFVYVFKSFFDILSL